MTPREYAIRCIKNALGNACDNLFRATLAMTPENADKPYGQSGRTLREIFAEYQSEVDDARAAMDYVSKE